jgi:hypothetical protein
MILSIIDTSRGRELITRRRWRFAAVAALAIALWLLLVHAR